MFRGNRTAEQIVRAERDKNTPAAIFFTTIGAECLVDGQRPTV